MNKEIIIDAASGTVGRIASFAAKQALLGKTIIIVNCNSAVVSNRNATLDKYRQARKRGGSGLKGPHFPKNPERIVKRTIRGMLSHRQGRGQSAFKSIKCYNEIPSEFQGKEMVSLKKELKIKSITLLELSKKI